MGLVGCITHIKRIVKLRKKLKHMAKNERKKGKSARNGNAPSPYTKYNKSPYKYSFNTGKLVYLDTYQDEKKSAYDNKKKNKRKAA